MEKALVHFSGGLDSMLATCKVIEDGFQANLVHYDNGFTSGKNFIDIAFQRMIDKYTSECVKVYGFANTAVYFKALRDIFANYKATDFCAISPDLSYGQINCLTCRSAMYIMSTIICMQNDIHTVVDGARRVQGFALERDMMIKAYREFFSSYGIDFLTPVLDLETDYDREIALGIRNIMPKASESKCLIGVPITIADEEEMLRRDEQALRIWKEKLEPMCRKLVDYGRKIPIDNRGNMY